MNNEIKPDTTTTAATFTTTAPDNNNNNSSNDSNNNHNSISNNKQEQTLTTSSTTSTSLKSEELSLESTEPSLKTYPQTTVSRSLGDIVGGSYTRRYLNDKVTPVLLEGMRRIAVEKPNDPLRVLGEYLIAESEKQK